MKNKEFKPQYRHRSYGLLVELSDDMQKYRIKGTSDSKSSGWRTVRETAEGIRYITCLGERMYISFGWDFVPCNSDGSFIHKEDEERYNERQKTF